MTVHLLAPDDSAYSINRHVARSGFLARGEEVALFEAGAFDDVPLTPDDIVVGGIKYAARAFERLGWNVPDLDPVPDDLRTFSGRSFWRSTLGDVRRRVSDGDPVFFKPIPSQPKIFAGSVARTVGDLIATASFDDQVQVDCADVVSFEAEFRTFVMHGEVIGVRPYKGDPLLFPDPDVIRNAVAAWRDAPAAWSLDVGVTSDGQTLLVEVNDSYALGAYGLPPMRYAAMIDARWQQLRQQNAGRGETA